MLSETAAEVLRLSPMLEALIGRDAAALATLICHLHADEAANRAASTAGLELIGHGFTADAITEGLRAAINGREVEGIDFPNPRHLSRDKVVALQAN